MEETKISVIVPVYNTEKWLERCITSIQRQTWQNLEIIIVDDGSTDESGQVAERLAQADSRIKVFHKPNGGASTARNMGIDNASGEYIGFIDSDDYIDPEMYARLMELIRQEDLLMAQTSRNGINEAGKVLVDIYVPPKETTVMESYAYIRELLLHRGDASFCTKLIKASLFTDERFPEGVLNEDFHLLMRLLPKVERIAVLAETYYHIFHRPDSTTRKRSQEEFPRVFLDIVDNADMMEAIIARACPVLKEEARRFALYQRLDYLSHIPTGQMTKENDFYQNVLRYIRRYFGDILTNRYLEGEFRFYLLLFCISPGLARKVRRMVKRKDSPVVQKEDVVK